MAKVVLTDIANISGNPATAENSVNNNNQAIEAAIENTLSRDGTEPNQMESTLDMNSNRIINLPAPVNGSEPLRLADAGSLVEITGTLLPPQAGHDGEFLGTDGSNIFWGSPEGSESSIAALINHLVPKGVILMWSGTADNVPTGWAFCNGQAVSGYGITPDLRNRFIVGAGDTLGYGATGGSVSQVTSPSGAHTPVIQNHTLDISEIPNHGHRFFAANKNTSDNSDGWGKSGVRAISGEDVPPFDYRNASNSGDTIIEPTGGSMPHGHGADSVPNHSHIMTDGRPPFYALAYIIKVSEYVAP